MLQDIQKLSVIYIRLLRFLQMLILAALIAEWLLASNEFIQALNKYGYFNPYVTMINQTIVPGNLDLKSRVVGLFSSLIANLPFLVGLSFLIKIFKNYQQGDIFSLDNATYYQRIAYLFILDGLIAKPLADILLSSSLMFKFPHAQVGFGINITNLLLIFCGMVLIFIAKVMACGYAIHQQQKIVKDANQLV